MVGLKGFAKRVGLHLSEKERLLPFYTYGFFVRRNLINLGDSPHLFYDFPNRKTLVSACSAEVNIISLTKERIMQRCQTVAFGVARQEQRQIKRNAPV